MFRKVIVSVLTLMIFYGGAVRSQDYKSSLSLANQPKPENISNNNSSFTAFKIGSMLFPLNPIFLIENKTFYVGITKEISLGKFPYGRIAFEYSLIFRETHVNQIRASYNFDIPLESGDLAAVLVSLGGGYFTDFSKEGFFPQASFNLLIPLENTIGINTYVKVRNTFMTEENESDIFDFSLGVGTVFYF